MEIYRNYKDKEKFSVSILWDELQKHYTHCGLCGRDTEMIMKIKI